MNETKPEASSAVTRLRVGDIVRLKSGSPNMTVNGVEVKRGVVVVYCVWFDKNNCLGRDRFPAASLVPSTVSSA